jgi:hypothetical protein
VAGDEAEAGFFHVEADAVAEAALPDGRVHDLVVVAAQPHRPRIGQCVPSELKTRHFFVVSADFRV